MSFGLAGRKCKKRNFRIGDIVIVYQDNVSRKHWPMARITGVNSNKKGLVRNVLLRKGERLGNENSKHGTTHGTTHGQDSVDTWEP